MMNNSIQRPLLGPISDSFANTVDQTSDNSFDCDSNSEIENPFSCSICKKQFATNGSLKRHGKTQHEGFMESKLQLQHKCDYCNRQFSAIKNLRYHQKSKHSAPTVEISSRKYHCTLCNNNFIKKDILDHFETSHHLQMKTDNLEFPNWEEFSKWKEAIEKDTKCNFVLNAKYHLKEGMCHSLICFRSGFYISKGTGIRHLKTQGSRKINGYCPAAMRATELEDGKCLVSFQKTHVGHLLPTPDENEKIAVKNASKLPFDTILDDVRNDISPTGLKRVDLPTNITETEESNIFSQLIKSPECRVKDNKNSLHIRKENMKQKFMEAIDTVSSIKEIEVLEKMYLSLNPTLNAFNQKANEFRSANKQKSDCVPANKNIDAQRTLYSTKKRVSKSIKSLVMQNKK